MKHLKLLLLAFVVAFTFACADDEVTSEFNSNKPTASVTQNGISLDASQPIEFNSSTFAEATKRTVITFMSTAQGGILELEATLHAEGNLTQSAFDIVNPLSILNPTLGSYSIFDSFFSSVSKGSHTASLDLSLFAALYFATSYHDVDNITINFKVTDANGTTRQKLVFHVVKDTDTSEPLNINVSNDTSDNITSDNLTLEELANDNTTVTISSDNNSTKINFFDITVIGENSFLNRIINNYISSYTNMPSFFYLNGSINMFDKSLSSSLGISQPNIVQSSTSIQFNLNPLILSLLDILTEYNPLIVANSFKIIISAGSSFNNYNTTTIDVTIKRPVDIIFSSSAGDNISTDTMTEDELSTNNITVAATALEDTTSINHATLTINTNDAAANTAIRSYTGNSTNTINLFDTALLENLGITLPNVIKGSNYIEFDINPMLIGILSLLLDLAPSADVSSFNIKLDVGASSTSIDSKTFTLHLTR